MRRRKVYVTLCLQSYRSADSFHPKKTFCCGEVLSRDHDLLMRYIVKFMPSQMSLKLVARVVNYQATLVNYLQCNVVSYKVPKKCFHFVHKWPLCKRTVLSRDNNLDTCKVVYSQQFVLPLIKGI